MKRIFLFPTIIFILLLAYAFNDVMSSRQAGFRDASREEVYSYLQAIILLLAGYSIFKLKKEIVGTFLSTIMWLIMLWGGLVNIVLMYDQWIATVHFSLTVWWLATYYFFYSYVSRNPAAEKYLKILFTIMFCFYLWANIFARRNILETFNIEYAVTGYAYHLVIFVPFFFLIKPVWFRAILVTVTTLIVFSSYKRGPIVILPLMLLIHQLTATFANKRWLSFTVKTILIVSFIIGIFTYVDEKSERFLSSRFSTEELEFGSGRDILREQSMGIIAARSFFDLLVGTGSGSSIHFLGTGVHNEWLEFLFNFGIIGVLLFGLFCIGVLRRYVALLREGSHYASSYGMMMVFLFAVSIFSGFYFTHWSFYFFAFMGFVEALISLEQNKQESVNKI